MTIADRPTTHQTLPELEVELFATCSVCHRPLSDPISMRAGIGPVCASKLGVRRTAPASPTTKERKPMPLTIPPYIILTREPDGTATANIAKAHRHHDTTENVEWGYLGSGPADLALNILALFLPGDDIDLWDGSRVSRKAWAWHQDFKAEVIAQVAYEGGVIPAEEIRHWIGKRTTA